MKILSYRVDDHDSNFCLYDNGQVRYYCPERNHQEKHYGYNAVLSKVKTDSHFPSEIFDIFSVDPNDIDIFVEVPDDPSYKSKIGQYWVNPNVTLLMSEENIFGIDATSYFVEHHWAHANSVWPLADDIEYSVVYDGVGSEGVFASIFHGDKRIEVLNRKTSTSFCFELCDIGSFCGIEASHNLDIAGKVMGYQSFGNQKIARKILDLLVSNYNAWDIPSAKNLISHLRDEYKPKDISMAYQMFIEISFIDWMVKFVPLHAKVSLTGGLGQNVLLNYQLSKIYKNLIIPPHVNDCGLSIGALKCVTDHYGLPIGKIKNFPYAQSDETCIETPSKNALKSIARALAEGKIVAWYQGNGEIGPRALGNRSILMNPTVKNGKDIINERVKKREKYRPFGASVLLEHVSDWFDWEGETPYMLHAVPVKNNRLKSVTHVDGTCRIQTVKDGVFYDLLKEFYGMTNVPVLLNTSLNLAGKPIAGRISEAVELFESSDIDVLCYGNTIHYK